MSQSLVDRVKKLPHVPGVYIYHNQAGEIIYVGKAKDLRSRVGSYFQLNLEPGTKTHTLVQNISDFEYIEVSSEFDALILESELIKKHLPKYNIMLKDDKSYAYIVIREKLPKLMVVRKTQILPKDVVFGPYPDGSVAKYIVKVLRRLFPFRDCNPNKFNRYSKLGSPCLFGHIGLCPAPCVNNSPQDLAKYKASMNKIKEMLQGKRVQVLNSMKSQMAKLAKSQNFEDAAELRNKIEQFEYIIRDFRSPENYINNPYFVDDLAEKSLELLKNSLPILTKTPVRIECYDIANISGKEAVASMVVATNGRINKSEYKKFKIRLKNTPDDFGMLREALTRRIKRGLKGEKGWDMPDLFVIDGGKGQVSATSKILQELGVEIPLVGLAKRFETLVFYQDGAFVELRLPKSDLGLALLIKLRDEAHRFAQAYHHKLRLNAVNISEPAN